MILPTSFPKFCKVCSASSTAASIAIERVPRLIPLPDMLPIRYTFFLAVIHDRYTQLAEPRQYLIARHGLPPALRGLRTPLQFRTIPHPLERLVFAALGVDRGEHGDNPRRLPIGVVVGFFERIRKIPDFGQRRPVNISEYEHWRSSEPGRESAPTFKRVSRRFATGF